MTDCDERLHPRPRQGILLSNMGKYFEAHKELDAAWKKERGRVRELYQGILEAGVTYLHITLGNYAGAIRVYARSMRRLKAWLEICRGVDVGQLRKDLEAAIAKVHPSGKTRLTEFNRSLLKPVALIKVGKEIKCIEIDVFTIISLRRSRLGQRRMGWQGYKAR